MALPSVSMASRRDTLVWGSMTRTAILLVSTMNWACFVAFVNCFVHSIHLPALILESRRMAMTLFCAHLLFISFF